MDDDLDFLTEDDGWLDAATAVEGVRAELLDWAAGALAARVPELRALRGTQHVAHARRDLDAHIRHVHNALVRHDAGELETYLRWAAQQPLHTHLAADVAILAEALQRFLPATHANVCTDLLVSSHTRTVAGGALSG